MESLAFCCISTGVFRFPNERAAALAVDAVRRWKAAMNLRCDDTFAEDEGWHAAFLRSRETQRVLYLELGIGGNTPAIIKYPFWRMTAKNPRAVYVCLNLGEAYAPDTIRERSICIDGDIGRYCRRFEGAKNRRSAPKPTPAVFCALGA